MTDPDGVIRAAEEVAGILETRGVRAVVIGAGALAAHGYVRRQARFRRRHIENPPQAIFARAMA